jgi:hypothetical protein
VNSGFNPRYIAAKPGTSSHERGQAVDVSDASTFDRIMNAAPPGSQLFNRVPGDFNHFSVSGYDQGGILPPGVTVAVNKTGHDETILPFPPSALVGRGETYEFHFHGPIYGGNREQVARELVEMIRPELYRIRKANGSLELA